MGVIITREWQKGHADGMRPFDPYEQMRMRAEEKTDEVYHYEMGIVSGITAPTWGRVIEVPTPGGKTVKSFIAMPVTCSKGKHGPTPEVWDQIAARNEKAGSSAPPNVKYAKPIFACGSEAKHGRPFSCHCIGIDPVHPERIYLMPKGYYVCQTCFDLIERKKFRFGENLIRVCHHCIIDNVNEMIKKDATLFVDLMLNPKG